MSQPFGELSQQISDSGVHFVRIGWVDNGGIYRAQAIRADRINQVENTGIGLASGVQAVPVHEDVGVAGLPIGPVGQVWLVPDRAQYLLQLVELSEPKSFH